MCLGGPLVSEAHGLNSIDAAGYPENKREVHMTDLSIEQGKHLLLQVSLHQPSGMAGTVQKNVHDRMFIGQPLLASLPLSLDGRTKFRSRLPDPNRQP